MMIRLARLPLLILLLIGLVTIGTFPSLTGIRLHAQDDVQDDGQAPLQENNQIYLPLIAAQTDDPPQSATPVVVIAADHWLPLPTATPTVVPVRTYPNWVPGTYNIRLDAREGWATYLADGTFAERFATFGGAETESVTGEWFVSQGQLFLRDIDQAGLSQQRRYLIERVEDGFRLAGGDARLDAYLYERRDPHPAVDAQGDESNVVSHWMRGTWRGTWGVTTYEFHFHAHGRYEMYAQPGNGEPVEEGRWSAWADTLIMQPTGATMADSIYTIESATQNFLSISHGRYGESDFGLLRERYTPPTNMDDYAGQYIADGVTITIEKGSGGGAFQPGIVNTYLAEVIADGNILHFGGMVGDDNRLILTNTDGRANYEPMRVHLNGLHYGRFEFPEWLTKVSERALPVPTSIHGLWVRSSESADDSDLWLLPDDRYVAIYRFGGSTYQTMGRYTVADGQLTLDAHCAEPNHFAMHRAGNQLVLRDAHLTLTYHYVPGKLADLVATVAQADEVQSVEDATFAGVLFLTKIHPDYRVGPDQNRAPDPTPGHRFLDATVFGRPAQFTRFAESSYYKNRDGKEQRSALTAVSPLDFILNRPIVDTLDFTQGPWQDKAYYSFYPNGRFSVHTETYADALSLDPVMPRIHHAWGRYTIENEVIDGELDDGTAVRYPLVHGRQRLYQDEQCFDHVPLSN